MKQKAGVGFPGGGIGNCLAQVYKWLSLTQAASCERGSFCTSAINELIPGASYQRKISKAKPLRYSVSGIAGITGWSGDWV